MKKTISILLAVLMACTLFACAAKEDDTPPDSAAVSSTPPSGSAPDSSASGTAEGEAADITKNADELGFFYDGVDPQSRDTYEIVFAYPWTSLLNQSLADCMRHFGKKLNLNVTQSTSENDMDQFVLNLETYIGQGNTDGFVVVIDYAALDRINEVLAESGIPYIGLFNSVKDESGSELIPCVGLDDIAAGATTLQWLYDNYKTYWGDVDESKIGLLNITTTVNIDLDERAIGAEEKFKELLPGNADKIYTVDCANELTQEKAFDVAAATFVAHPEVEYWFCTNCLELYSQGVARAVESLQNEDKVLIIDVGSDILCSEWDNSYDGSWIACMAISNFQYTAPTICGLVAMIDGVATPESLWVDQRAPGDKCTFFVTDNMIVTRDTYQEYFNKYAQLAEAPLPYPDN